VNAVRAGEFRGIWGAGSRRSSTDAQREHKQTAARGPKLRVESKSGAKRKISATMPLVKEEPLLREKGPKSRWSHTTGMICKDCAVTPKQQLVKEKPMLVQKKESTRSNN
jgi:hypothetical protein